VWEDYSGLLDSYCAVLGIVIAGICTILAGIVTQNHRSRLLMIWLDLLMTHNPELTGEQNEQSE